MIVRPYDSSDAGSVAALINVIEGHAGGHPSSTSGAIQALVAALVLDVASDTRLRFAGDGTLVAAALNLSPPAGGFRCDVMGGVHPHWRGRGIGRELLSWQLAGAALAHKSSAATEPWEITASALAGDRAAARLYGRFGLEAVRHWLKMSTDLVPPPRPLPLPDGVRTTPYSPEYEQPLHAVHMEAFADHWNYQMRGLAEWTTLTVRSATFAPELSVIALAGDDLVGYVLAYHHTHPDQLYIGQVGVHRRWRGRGLATALINRSIVGAAAAGKRSASLLTDAANPTGSATASGRAGFTVHSRRVTYGAPLTACATRKP